MTIHVRAPATTANLGPGFDVAGAALELWNELVVGEPNGSVDDSHLGVRAFARYAKPSDWSFTFTVERRGHCPRPRRRRHRSRRRALGG